MQATDVLIPTLAQYLIQLPVYLIWLVGIVLALRYRQHARRGSTLVIVALVVFLVRSLIDTALNMWLPVLLMDQGWGAQRLGLLMTGRNVISVLIAAVAWGLLIWALADAWRRLRPAT